MRRTASGLAMGGLLVWREGMSIEVHALPMRQETGVAASTYPGPLKRPREPTIRRQTEALGPKKPEIRAAVAPRSAIRLDAELHEARLRTWRTPDFLVSPQSEENVLLPRLVVLPTR